jgi:hypothetical protein
MATANPDFARRPATRVPRTRAAWLAAALIAGCGGGEALLIPFFTFGFAFNGTLGGANHDVFLNLNPNAPTTPSGNFDTGSTLRIDTDSRVATGSYSGCTLTFSVGPATSTPVSTLIAASYTGRFKGANTIELTPGSGTFPVLTVTRSSGSDTRPETC